MDENKMLMYSSKDVVTFVIWPVEKVEFNLLAFSSTAAWLSLNLLHIHKCMYTYMYLMTGRFTCYSRQYHIDTSTSHTDADHKCVNLYYLKVKSYTCPTSIILSLSDQVPLAIADSIISQCHDVVHFPDMSWSTHTHVHVHVTATTHLHSCFTWLSCCSSSFCLVLHSSFSLCCSLVKLSNFHWALALCVITFIILSHTATTQRPMRRDYRHIVCHVPLTVYPAWVAPVLQVFRPYCFEPLHASLWIALLPVYPAVREKEHLNYTATKRRGLDNTLQTMETHLLTLEFAWSSCCDVLSSSERRRWFWAINCEFSAWRCPPDVKAFGG